jgi:hypothetical protein
MTRASAPADRSCTASTRREMRNLFEEVRGERYSTSHQSGAHHAPLVFVAGELFPKTVPQQVYAKGTLPVLVDPYTSCAALDAFTQPHPRASQGLQQNEVPARAPCRTCGTSGSPCAPTSGVAARS